MSILPAMAPLGRVSPSLMGRESIFPFCSAETMTSSDSKTPEASVFSLFWLQEDASIAAISTIDAVFLIELLFLVTGCCFMVVLGQEQLHLMDYAVLAGLCFCVDIIQVIVGVDDSVGQLDGGGLFYISTQLDNFVIGFYELLGAGDVCLLLFHGKVRVEEEGAALGLDHFLVVLIDELVFFVGI